MNRLVNKEAKIRSLCEKGEGRGGAGRLILLFLIGASKDMT